MKLNLKKLIIIFTFALSVIPAYANISGGISQTNFYDTEKTIMTDLAADKEMVTEKYWSKNLFYPNKYKPLFMLSNKDLFDLTAPKKISRIQRNDVPSVYNISFKTSSIKTVSLKTAQKEVKNTAITQNKESENLLLTYEQAKNSDTEIEDKINAAVALKNSKATTNYKLALDLLNDVTKAEPTNAYAYYLKGELFALQNSPKSAMKNYVEALKINPTSKQCYTGIAKILEPNNKELAQKYYDMAKN